jgi:nucleotide-binding universal stress UspA family protein
MIVLNHDHILVPTDFSEQADRAVEIGLSMASEPDNLTVLHVAPPLGNFSAGDPAIAWNSVSDEARSDHLEKLLQKRFGDERFKGVNFDVVFGSPAEEIAHYAEQDGVDLIVLPSHGRTGLARLMIGSVAERVVRLAHCPVLVLRD